MGSNPRPIFHRGFATEELLFPVETQVFLKSNLYSQHSSLLWKKPSLSSNANYSYSISESHNKILLNYLFSFCGFYWGKEILNCSIEYLYDSLVVRVIMYFIDSCNSFRFTKIFQDIVLNNLHLSVWCQSGISYVKTHFLGCWDSLRFFII